MRFLVECTYVFEHPNDNSGIQRVVRNVVNCLPNLETKEECIPVIFRQGKMFRVQHLTPVKFEKQFVNLRKRVDDLRTRYWYLHHRLHGKGIFAESHTLRRLLFLLFRSFSIIYLVPLTFLVAMTRMWIGKGRIEPFVVNKDDVLILLDSSWHATFFNDVEKLKQQGIRIIGVMYDLIPLTHPQFCDKHLVTVFSKWFKWITGIADGFMCISRTVSLQLADFNAPSRGQWYDHFYLGNELDQENAGSAISSRVRKVFQNGRSVYLMVSTIEPRKNHAYLIDAFDQLWKQGSDISLCFVGKVGWKCEALIERIGTHPERERRLFMLNGLTDRELAYCYKSSKALVFSSFVEGFGLPLIEALGRGLPVLASDIPVFREVIGDYGAYFDLADPASLRNVIECFELEDPAAKKAMLASWKWLSWRDSAEQLIGRIKNNLDEKDNSGSVV